VVGGETLDVIDPPSRDELDLAPPRLVPPQHLAEWCRLDDVARAGHTYGKSFRDVVRALDRRWDRPPDVVVTPPDEAGVVAVLEWASQVGAVVIPYGGGSSVVGGVEAPADDDRPDSSAPRARPNPPATIVERAFATVGDVPDLTPEEAEVLRRSIAMLPAQAPSGLSRERALAILGQLVRALSELRRR